MVQVSTKQCNVFNSDGKWIMGGLRIADNRYGVEPSTTLSYNKVMLIRLSGNMEKVESPQGELVS